MIWDYQRSSLFTVVWHGAIVLERGQQIRVAGYFDSPAEPTRMFASSIIERDGTVHEQVEESDQPGADLYPLQGRVVECRSYQGDTIIDVYQTIPNLFSFPNLSHHRAFLMLPEFWNFLEERSEFEELVLPSHRRIRELNGTGYEFPDIRDPSWAIHRFGILSGSFPRDFVLELSGKVHVKLAALARLKDRASFGNRMKLHLLTLKVCEGRSYLLDELVQEAPMTLEHAAFVGYSVLDLCALLVNGVLRLSIPDKQVSFTSVLGKESEELGTSSLSRNFNSHPLTRFWVQEQAGWIASFRDFRHYLAHEGALTPIYGPSDRLLSAAFDRSAERPSAVYDVETEISTWLERLTGFFAKTLDLLAEHCRKAVTPYEVEPARPPIKSPTPITELENAFQDVLRLLFQRPEENPDRVDHLYSRLEPSWRKRWPIAKFRAFLGSWEGVAMKPREPVSASADGSCATMSCVIQFLIDGKPHDWLLKLRKTNNRKPFLIGDSLSTPSFQEPLFTVSDYNARQSGRESGHACAEFRFAVSNQSDHTLEDVLAIVMHGGLEAARSPIGTMQPGESKPVFVMTTRELGMLLPPGGPYMFVTLISEPIQVRLVYRRATGWGDEWAEEHVCQNPRRAG